MDGTDFFRARLDTMIDLRHPLAVLSTRLPWSEIESNLAPVLAHKNRAELQEKAISHPTDSRLLEVARAKIVHLAKHAGIKFKHWIALAHRILTQKQKDKNKLYALHAPEVECISKGKSRKPHEFGVKVSIASGSSADKG